MRIDGREVGHIMQIQKRGETLTEAKKGDEVAISIKGNVLVGRHFDEGDVLYTSPSEKELELVVTKFKEYLTPDMIPLIKEIIKIKQRKDKSFGLSILFKLKKFSTK